MFRDLSCGCAIHNSGISAVAGLVLIQHRVRRVAIRIKENIRMPGCTLSIIANFFHY